MGKKPETESSSLGCILSGTWTLAALPFWLGAVGLLVVSTTSASKLFAIALICLLPIPLNFLHWQRTSRKIVSVLLLVIGSVAFFFCARQAADYTDNPEARARVIYENGTNHSRYSVANLVPEVDQYILGSYLLGAIDPNLSWNRAADLRRNVRDIYADLQNDADLAPLPCVLGLLGFGLRHGPPRLRSPPGTPQGPVGEPWDDQEGSPRGQQQQRPKRAEGGPRGATTTLIIDTYKQALGNYKFGRGAARAVVVMILLTLFAGFYLALLAKINKKVANE